MKVIQQLWEKVTKPNTCCADGCSYHLTEKDKEDFIKEYWANMPEKAPNSYSKPLGKSKLKEIDDDLYRTIKSSKNGVRVTNAYSN